MGNDNIKWIAEFDFTDIYKKKIDGFNPGSSIELERAGFANDNTVILAGLKKMKGFDPQDPSAERAVVFISKDLGKSYKEILLDDAYAIKAIFPKNDYTLNYTKGYIEEVRIAHLYLLNNRSLKIDYQRDFIDKIGDIFMDCFDGKYIHYAKLKDKAMGRLVINLFDEKEVYKTPEDQAYYPFRGNGNVIYLDRDKEIGKGNTLMLLDLKTQKKSVYKKFNDSYSWIEPNYQFFNESSFIVSFRYTNKAKKEYIAEYYDLEENKLFEVAHNTEDEYRRMYHYGDFICNYRSLGGIKFSFDRGKTWQTHSTPGFRILNKRIGFYKDKYIVAEGIFSGKGPRIMIGEFQRAEK